MAMPDDDQPRPPDPICMLGALRYANKGLRVIPIHPGTKRPVGDNWPERASNDADVIRRWWKQNPDYGVGICTGWYGDRCIFVLDVDDGTDPKTGRIKQGSESLADLEQVVGPIPDTVEGQSGGGGRHIFLWSNIEIRNDQAGRLGVDLDLRGVGGQVVAHPTIHPDTGRPYAWIDGRDVDDFRIARSPHKLDELLTAEPAAQPRAERAAYEGPPRPGDRFAAAVTWPELLQADGATFLGNRRDKTGGVYELWARPGEDHTSATLYYGGTDVLKVFSSNWPGLTQDATYTRFGYWTATRHGGNHSKAASELSRAQFEDDIRQLVAATPPNPDAGTADSSDEQTPPAAAVDGIFIDWPSFWAREKDASGWLYEPILAKGRGHALFAGHKVGKSLLLLSICAKIATGPEPVVVIYLDYEMTEDDVEERLTDMGYGPDDDLSRLRYALLPSLSPLDTAEGGQELCKIVDAEQERWAGYHLVVLIDTMARGVSGPEDSADTYRAFYTNTGIHLKRRGVTWGRLDHAGKDPTKGQRGSSGKGDDVDVVWEVRRSDNGLLLVNRARRMGWVPPHVALEELANPLAFRAAAQAWPAGTAELAGLLDDLGVPVDSAERPARELLKKNDEKATAAVLRAALKYRREMQ